MLMNELARRKVPEFMPESAQEWPEKRKQLLEMLQKEEYGFQPPACPVTPENIVRDERCYGSKCLRLDADLRCDLPQGSFSFPASAVIPKCDHSVPAVVFISFSDQIPYKNLPAEEITDNGVAVFSFFYKSVVPDDMEAMSGELPKLLFGDNRKPDDAGAISLWAWAASRVLDWALTMPEIKHDQIAVVGQSRLGKTALLAAALDERFAVAHSNESGCCGAAISRGKEGEDFEAIIMRFPYWFCTNFHKYSGKENDLPFDQDALIACIAPRRAYVASAEQDLWCDGNSEYLACASAGRIWELLGEDGFVAPNRFPKVGEAFQAGNVGYHLRPGTHTMNRFDWHHFLAFFLKNK